MEREGIPYLSATELSRLIQKRELSPVEVVEDYLERIDRVDSELNSYITVSRDAALDAARQAEQVIARGGYLGPMHGIPVAVKDQVYTKGVRTTGGSTILADFVPDEDATVVANLKKAGAILLGKLNMSEFAIGGAFHHPYGTPHNPWDLERDPGTSSSGSGAATAAFLCATSLGEDTGGSIRRPAAFCGLVGLRPTYGRVSRHGVLGLVWSTDTVGPMSRTAEDCAITLGAIAGYDSKDPYTWNVPVPDYRQALIGDIRGIKVGVIRDRVESEDIEPDVRGAIIKSITVLGELGASLEDISIPMLPYSSAIFTPQVLAEGAAVHHRWIRERLKDYDYNVQVRHLTGSIMPAQAYHKAQKLRAILRQQILEVLEKFDVLVLPGASFPASKLLTGPASSYEDEPLGDSYLREKAGYFGHRSDEAPASLAGVPALCVPCGFVPSERAELPVALQIVGRPFDEATVLKVAHAYEQNTPWHTRRPPI